MALAPGTVVGQYRLEKLIATGGMGEVYKARHLMLARDVAIKMLPADANYDETKRLRFMREARAVAGLQHPNIVTIYDVLDLDGTLYIAMEYIEGATLQQVLLKGPLKPNLAVLYAIQIARAIAAAHQKGVLHRDIKPGNVMVSRTNTVKVLDFGLSKLFDTEDGTETAETLTMAGNVALTRVGRVCGTVGYMSPEQAQGRPLDGRTDVFSLGTVLYEMFTGSNPFQSSSEGSTMTRIVNEDPPSLAKVVPGIPETLTDIVALCLKKAPEDRAHSMHDIACMLEFADHQLAASDSSPKSLMPRHRGSYALMAAGGILLGAAIGMSLATRSFRREPVGGSLQRVTFDGGLARSPAISEDGKVLAFASDRGLDGNLDIFVRHIAGGEPIRRTTDQADDYDPAFSPDSSTIAFRSERRGGGIYTMPTFAGQERLVAPDGNNPRFSPDGKWLAYWVGEATKEDSGRLYVMPAEGGPPQQLQNSFADARYPIWSPDGTHILFEGSENTSKPRDWYVAALDSGAAVRTGAWDLFRQEGLVAYQPGGWRGDSVVFSARRGSSRSLYTVHLSSRSWRPEGVPEALTFGTSVDGMPYPAANGPVVFASLQYEINVWTRHITDAGEPADKDSHKLTSGAAYRWAITMSADCNRLAFLERDPRQAVRIIDLSSRSETVVADAEGAKCSAAISPDGNQIAWSPCGSKADTIWLSTIASDLSLSIPRTVCQNCGRVSTWSRESGQIAFAESSGGGIGILSLSSGRVVRVKSAKYGLDNPVLSPDANWLAASGNSKEEPGVILVIPIVDGSPSAESSWLRVSDRESRADKPAWLPTGRGLIFYSKRDGFGCLWRQRLNGRTKAPEGAPEPVLHFHGSRLSLQELSAHLLSLCVAGRELAFSLLESTGSIWALDVRQHTVASR